MTTSIPHSYRQAATNPLTAAVRRAVCVGLTYGLATTVCAAAFPPVMRLSSLHPDHGGDGTFGFVVTGRTEVRQHYGWALSAAGDVNNDGIGDLIVGTGNTTDWAGIAHDGATFVVFGSDDGLPALFDLLQLFPERGGDGSAGFALEAILTQYCSGCAVSGGGDVNGDGIDDLFIGAPYADPDRVGDAGGAYVVFGRDIAQTGNFPALFPLVRLKEAGGGDGSQGFVINGSGQLDQAGIDLSIAGDVNGDGIDDLIIGAHNADPPRRPAAGESYVLFGSTSPFPAEIDLASLLPENGGDGTKGFVLTGIRTGDRSGTAVSGAGDINGDGIDDLVIGAPEARSGGEDLVGEAYVIYGRNGGGFPAVFPLARLFPQNGGDGSEGFVLTGAESSDDTGHAVAAVGDVNADGLDDLIIGAPNADPVGEALVVFGRDAALSGPFPAVFPLERLRPGGGGDGSEGFIIIGMPAGSNANVGFAVASAEDVNGDGIDDILVGDPDWSGRYDAQIAAGAAYVVFGRDTAEVGDFPPIFPLSKLLPSGGGDGTSGFVLTGAFYFGHAGFAVSSAGDINADGRDDIVVGAPNAESGQAYVVYGRTEDTPAR